MADIGMAQIQSDLTLEKPLITAGDDLNNLMKILKISSSGKSYKAADVLSYLDMSEKTQHSPPPSVNL